MNYIFFEKTLIAFVLLILLVGCDDQVNNDAAEELSCENVSGTWIANTVSCGDVELSQIPFTAMQYTANSNVQWVQGGSSCQRISKNVLRFTDPFFDLIGLGFYECESYGTSVNSCSSQIVSCSDHDVADGTQDAVATCAIENGTLLKLSRTATEIDIANGLSFCETPGVVEKVGYLQAVEGDAVIGFSGGGSVGFGSVLQYESNEASVLVTNRGTLDASQWIASDLTGPFSFKGGSYPGEGGDCGSVIPGISQCILVFEFAPQEVKLFTQILNFSFLVAGAPTSVDLSLSGYGEQPLGDIIITNPSAINFQQVPIQSLSQLIVEFRNIGTGPASLFGAEGLVPPFYFTGGSFPGTLGNCQPLVGRNETCSIELEFRPQVVGFFQGPFQFQFNNGVENRVVQTIVSGTGIGL